jgi:hypothetical protein
LAQFADSIPAVQDSDIQDLQKRLAALEAQLRKQDTPGVSVADTDDLSVELRHIEARASSIAGMHGTAGKKELSETYGSLENTLVKEGLVDARKLPVSCLYLRSMSPVDISGRGGSPGL